MWRRRWLCLGVTWAVCAFGWTVAILADQETAAGAGLVLVSFGYTETPAAELAPDVLIHHFDEAPEACVRALRPLPAA